MFKVNIEKCISCGACIKDCPVKDIEFVEKKALIKNNACVKCGHCIAICPVKAISTDDYDMNEVIEYNKNDFDIKSDNFLNFIKYKRTIRNFKNQDIENEKILKIIEAGRFAPTSGNTQNVKYIVVKDKLQELRKMTLEILNDFGKEVLESSTNKLQIKYAKMWIEMYNDYILNPLGNDRLFYKAPILIIVTSEHSLNAGIASANMKLMTDILGLGSVFSGFLVRACERDSSIKEFLGINGNQNIVSCMAIGYPNVKYFRTVPRKSPDIIWK